MSTPWGDDERQGIRNRGLVLKLTGVSCSTQQESPPPSSAHTTPSHAPTPTSTFAPPLSARESLARDSNHPTPTSATSTKGGAGWKKNKNKSGSADREKDEEGDAGDNVKQAKRLKISYGRD